MPRYMPTRPAAADAISGAIGAGVISKIGKALACSKRLRISAFVRRRVTTQMRHVRDPATYANLGSVNRQMIRDYWSIAIQTETWAFAAAGAAVAQVVTRTATAIAQQTDTYQDMQAWFWASFDGSQWSSGSGASHSTNTVVIPENPPIAPRN